MTFAEALPIHSKLDAETIRRDFPILCQVHPNGKPLVYLDSAASAQRPTSVIHAMSRFYETDYANVHRGIHYLSERATELYDASRKRVASWMNASGEDEIVFTSGCTAAINLFAHGWGNKNIQAGDRILVTIMEHHANLVPWFQLAERRGATVECVGIDEAGRLDASHLDQLLSSQPQLLAITAVSNVLGTVNPLHEIIAKAHAQGCKVLVDAAQAAPHEPIDLQDMDCDFMAVSSHKLMGPTGIGVAYAKRQRWAEMEPFMGGGGMIASVTTSSFTPTEAPYCFEAGTPPIAEAIGLAAAIDYLEHLDLIAVQRYVHDLTRFAYSAVGAIDGVRVLGPDPEHRSGLVSFIVKGVHPHDVAQVLDQQGIAVRAGHHCAMPLHEHLKVPASLRASFYVYNTERDVVELCEGIRTAKSKFRR